MANLSNMQYGQDGNPELEDIKRAYDQIDDNGTPLRRNISTQENALMTDIDTVEKQQNKAVAANERAQAEAARSRGRYGVQLTGAEQNELTGVKSALAQLQSFRDIGVARENSYTKARAGAKRSYYGFLGNIAGTVGKVIGAGG